MDRTADKEVQSLIDMLDTAINEIRLDQMQDKNSKLIARNPGVSRKPVKIQNRLGNQRAGTASIKEEDIAALRRVSARLDRKVTTPRLRSAIFRAIRNRFLSTFRRNQLQMHTAGVQQPINGGNPMVAHEGNCVADAYLYKIGQRKDAATFIELYGIPPQVVSSLNSQKHTLAIETINDYGTYRSKAHVPIRLKLAYDGFISALIWNMDPGHLEDVHTKVGRRYQEFLSAKNKYGGS